MVQSPIDDTLALSLTWILYMSQPELTRRQLPLALAGTVAATGMSTASAADVPDGNPPESQAELMWKTLQQRYDLSELSPDQVVKIRSRIHIAIARSEELKRFPLPSGAEPAGVYMAAPELTHGGAPNAE